MVDFAKHHKQWWSTSGTTLAPDGCPLAFAFGSPAPGAKVPLVCSNGLGVSTFFWDYIGAHFTRLGHRVVVWDYPGHGASGAPAELRSLSMGSLAEALLRVMDATQTETAVLLGHSLGCQVILEFARRWPDRVVGLVPVLGGFGHIADTIIDPRFGPLFYRGGYYAASVASDWLSFGLRLALHRPMTWRLLRWTGLVHPDLARRDDMEPYLEHLARLDLRVFFEFLRAAQEHDLGPVLGDFDVPALIVAGERDLFTPHHLSMEMAERMPRAELLEIPRGSHAALIEQPELINLRLEKFLRESVEPFADERRADASCRNGHPRAKSSADEQGPAPQTEPVGSGSRSPHGDSLDSAANDFASQANAGASGDP